jgi:hypothetical protein
VSNTAVSTSPAGVSCVCKCRPCGAWRRVLHWQRHWQLPPTVCQPGRWHGDARAPPGCAGAHCL